MQLELEVEISSEFGLNIGQRVLLHLVDLVGAELGLVLELRVVNVHGHVDDQRIELSVDAVLDLRAVFKDLTTVNDFQVRDTNVLLAGQARLNVMQVKDLIFELADRAAQKPHRLPLEALRGHALFTQNVAVVF